MILCSELLGFRALFIVQYLGCWTGFWLWCFPARIIGFPDFFHCLIFRTLDRIPKEYSLLGCNAIIWRVTNCASILWANVYVTLKVEVGISSRLLVLVYLPNCMVSQSRRQYHWHILLCDYCISHSNPIVHKISQICGLSLRLTNLWLSTLWYL
jgi:hypothetical protein